MSVSTHSDSPPTPRAPIETQALQQSFEASLAAAARHDEPYRHWTLDDVFGATACEALANLPFPAPELGGVSGARELHNNTRTYFDRDNNARFPVCAAVAEAFQSQKTVRRIAEATGASIDGCYLRIEYAQDVDGFWLQPHTDLGVKKLTMLCYLSGGEDEDTLGTDIYANKDTWSKRSPFVPNSALLFVPSNDTWHGFEPRQIKGVRKTVIINYVTDDWRAREQLAEGDAPVRL